MPADLFRKRRDLRHRGRRLTCIVGLRRVGLGVTNLPSGDIAYITANTDPAMPGVTRFVGAAHAGHWRNLSTGATGSVIVEWPSVDVRTGPGIVVATATGWGLTILAGAGGWTVP
ncbi:hypothetical protein [Rhodococcus sp. (in: high G+C Gram-positive bacteria)]|uniref:hypothetical protein n=1 Tax=Rhodococcus sp. TaxID=1831 RepID=UPI003B8A7C15